MYLDYNATAPLRPIVKQAITNALDLVGNPSSVHRFGRSIRTHIEGARENVAAYFCASPKNVIFTSGATEANNMVIKQHEGPILVSAIEHDSVYSVRPDATVINVDENGVIDLDHLETSLRACTEKPLVAVMAANNETGVIQPLRAVFDLCEKYNAYSHIDAVQAIGKIAFDYSRATTVTLSGHKIGGLSGVGSLIKAQNYHPKAFIKGGGQERSFRSGTENSLGIISLGAAMSDLANDDWKSVERLRDLFETKILEATPDAVIFGKNTNRLPNTCNVAMPRVKSDLQLILFDQKGMALSSGSACSSGKVKASRVLKAMNVDPSLLNNAIRISFGPHITEQDVHALVDAWLSIYYPSNSHHTNDHIQSFQETLCHAAV